MKSESSDKRWTKPELKRLGTIRDVSTKVNVLRDGQSNNFNFGS